MKDFYTIIDLYHEEEMISNRPASHHHIFGRRIIDYMLKALQQAAPKGIIALVDKKEFFHYMDDTVVTVTCKARDMSSIQDIIAEYGKDNTYLVLPGAVFFDVVDVVAALREAAQSGSNMINIVDADSSNVFEIKNRLDLAQAAKIVQTRTNRGHMLGGVTIISPENTYIGPDVKIGADTTIYPGTIIEGGTIIGTNCTIGQNCRLIDMKIGNNVEIWDSTCLESEIGYGTTVGPYAYLRPGSILGQKCKAGAFVELKNATIGDGRKSSPLSHVGDAAIGRDVNIGCGVVTVNYDGKKKCRTVVEDGAFIGSNTNLVAPVKIGKGAYTAAGSTITGDVPECALGIARERQTNIEDWAKR